MSVPAGYKATEVGVIPEDWDARQFEKIAHLKSGKTITQKSIEDYGSFPVYGGNGLRGYTSTKTHSGRFSLIGRQGALCGNVNFVSGDFFASEHAIVVTALDNNDPRFLYFVLGDRNLNALAESSAQPGLSVEKLRPLAIACPEDQSEQIAIAEALSDMDEAIAAQDAVIAKKRALKTATMQALLTRSRRLPGFSGEWVKVQIGKLGRWVGGATPSMANARYWTNGTIPWASSSDVRSGRLSSTGNRITAEAVKNTATREVPAGTILMVTRSGILRRFLPVTIATRNIAINQDLKALLVDPTFDPNFIYHAISVQGDDILKMCMKAGTTVESIDLDWLKQFEIDIPEDKYEQAAIATALFDCEDEIILLEAKLAKLRDLKVGMMQQLLTGKIRLV
jgi:type I restriction enzyme, S subunit